MLKWSDSRQGKPDGSFIGCALGSLVLCIALGIAMRASAQDAKSPYPSMAPLDQYLIADQSAEIALARSAAPVSISGDAEVRALGRSGYQTVAKGTNGFVCIVERSWTADVGDPNFWNPKLRAPICFNGAAARSFLPRTIRRTELILGGRSEDEMFHALEEEVAKGALPPIEAGSMCYMMSKQQYLGDQPGHWHPHVMFFVPQTDPGAWGANQDGSPVLGFPEPVEKLTTFMVPVRVWSDGTPDLPH
jgi:hypothetical protein